MSKVYSILVLTLASLFFSAFTPEKNTRSFPVILRAGVSVFVQLNEELDANQVAPGNAIEFTVHRDVTVNGKVLIAAGSPATGIVRKVESACKKGCSSATCSKLTIAIESAQAVDGQTVRLNAKPHVVNAPCCKGKASLSIGVNLSSNVLNDIKINA